jgi:hypothetical protein
MRLDVGFHFLQENLFAPAALIAGGTPAVPVKTLSYFFHGLGGEP